MESTCSECGKPLGADTVEGMCPQCLMKVGVGTECTEETRSSEAQPSKGKRPTFVPPAPEELAPKFPQLEILELVGRGGMGAVYKARQKQLGRIVALKILPPTISDQETFAERFAHEARALASLNHSNIVVLYEFGQAENLFYFLMEFVDGVNLRQLLQSTRMEPREALAIVPQICDALQYAHDHGIVHRDIKPENILLDRKGRVKVADFGIARLLQTETTQEDSNGGESITEPVTFTEAGKVLGTPQYMAPEQVTDPKTTSFRADVYSVGVVFYEMLTGELPGKRIEPPSKKVQIDVRIDEIVLRALEKKPELRFQQAGDIKTELETIATTPHKSVPPPAVSSETQDTSAIKPRCSRLAILSTGCLLLFSVLVLAWYSNLPSNFVTGRRDMNGAELTPLAALAAIGTTIFGWVAIGRIRRSGGRLYGTGLALFSGLLFPLLVVNFVICELWVWYIFYFVASHRNLGHLQPPNVPPDFVTKLANLIADQPAISIFPGLVCIAVVDIFILFRVRRFLSRPVLQADGALKNVFIWNSAAATSVVAISILLCVLGYGFRLLADDWSRSPVSAQYGNYSTKVEHLSDAKRTILLHHDGRKLHHAVFHFGDFHSSVSDSNNPRLRVWDEQGILTLTNGRKFEYERSSTQPEQLRINDEKFHLDAGLVLVLNDNGVVEQLPMFMTLDIARDLDLVAEHVQKLFNNPSVYPRTNAVKSRNLQSQKSPGMGWDALNEIRFTAEQMKEDIGLNIDNGRIVTTSMDSPHLAENQFRKNGADVFYDSSKAEWLALDTPFISWDQDSLDFPLEQLTSIQWRPFQGTSRIDLFPSCYFRTGEGRLGILQLVKQPSDGATIRYKLASSQEAGSTWGESTAPPGK